MNYSKALLSVDVDPDLTDRGLRIKKNFIRELRQISEKFFSIVNEWKSREE